MRWETNEMNPVIIQSFQAEEHGGVAQVEHGKLPELRRQSQQKRDAKASRVHKTEYWREERFSERENCRDL